MELSGSIKVIGKTNTYGTNNFRKREMVLTTDEQYPQDILIEFIQDKCDLLNNFVVGQPVTVAYNLNGREWLNPQGEAKYFNSLIGWKITATNDSKTQKEVDSLKDDPFEGGDMDLPEDDDAPF